MENRYTSAFRRGLHDLREAFQRSMLDPFHFARIPVEQPRVPERFPISMIEHSEWLKWLMELRRLASENPGDKEIAQLFEEQSALWQQIEDVDRAARMRESMETVFGDLEEAFDSAPPIEEWRQRKAETATR